MKARDLTDLALRNLREALFRNALTTLGVAVGVASLVAMLSLGVGLQELASKRLSQSGLFDTILVTPKNSFRGAGRPQREEQTGKPAAAGLPVRVLDEDARKEIEKLPSVIEVYSQVRFFTEVCFNGKPFATTRAFRAGRNWSAFMTLPSFMIDKDNHSMMFGALAPNRALLPRGAAQARTQAARYFASSRMTCFVLPCIDRLAVIAQRTRACEASAEDAVQLRKFSIQN